MEWKLDIVDVDGSTLGLSFDQLEEWKENHLPVEDYVPGKLAEAVSLRRIRAELSLSSPYKYVIFQASDNFNQQISMDDAEASFLVYKQNGEPLTKGFPVRLYVPTGESDCVNVKSVVRIQFTNK